MKIGFLRMGVGLAVATVVQLCSGGLVAADSDLEISVFQADATPEISSPLCYGNVRAVKEIVDPLTSRGVVFHGAGDPVVLCVVDFVGINNESNERWRQSLADAAGTSIDRVSVHTVHNHDAPGCDISAASLLEKQGLKDVIFNRSSHDAAIEAAAAALKESLKHRKKITHIGKGVGIVEKFASNRRVIGENGKIKYWRASSCRNEKAKAEPEGTIDPEVNLMSLWSGDKAVMAMTFYATHPQSHYGKGGVTPDTAGLARLEREKATGIPHIHFTGAGGNIAAGKYNDGSPENRAVLTGRLVQGMKLAWEAQKLEEIDAGKVNWKSIPVSLPWRGKKEEEMEKIFLNSETSVKERVRTARDLVYFRRWKEGKKINIGRLRLGSSQALFFPGELFVEYQLEAKKLRPEELISVAAYGDGAPGYIGTEISYSEGGYEVGRVSLTDSGAEGVLMPVIRALLQQ